MHDLSAFQRDILVVLADLDDPYGLRIQRELGDYYEEDVHHGRLYPNLDKLAERGLVEKDQRDERTNEYRLTEQGERKLRSHRLWENEHAVEELTP